MKFLLGFLFTTTVLGATSSNNRPGDLGNNKPFGISSSLQTPTLMHKRQLVTANCGTVSIKCVPEDTSITPTCEDVFRTPTEPKSCDIPATEMLFAYTGGTCEESFNAYSQETFLCRDFNGGPSRTTGTTNHIVVTSPRQVGSKYFMGDVDVGLVFAAAANDSEEILPETMIMVYQDDSMETLLQMMVFKTDCSSGSIDLELGDDFGSVTLVSFTTNDGVVHNNHASILYEITLTNEDPNKNVTVASVVGMRDGEADPFGSDLTGKEIPVGDGVTIIEELTIDLSMAQAQEHSVGLTASFHDGSNTCMGFGQYEVNWQEE